jgi:Nucleotidyl transferase AbiEii toxin, Type IV TA system
MTLLRDSPDDLSALCGAAADWLGIPEPAFVEKDFWVVELLRSVVRPLDLEPVNNIPCSATVRFKGGTSLSKAFGLIKRFSEDVDILVQCEGYGAGARENRSFGLSASVSGGTWGYRPNSYPGCRTEQASPGTPTIWSQPSGFLRHTAGCPPRDGDPRWHDAWHPVPEFSSYIADYIMAAGIEADFEELAPVGADVIAPVRTWWRNWRFSMMPDA